MYKVSSLKKEVQKFANPVKAKNNEWFFKTGKGEYGEGDQFAGLTVPECRAIAKMFRNLSLEEVKVLLSSAIHEERLIALLILVDAFQHSKSAEDQKEVYNFYLSNTRFVNNWDLVDTSAHKIVGEYLWKNYSAIGVLKALAKSDRLWDRRIAMIATAAFIRRNDLKPTLTIASMLIHDKQDLIQKATGWMLREVGKYGGQDVAEDFLRQHYKQMGRTALRYAIERFPEELRKQYLAGKV